MFRLASSSSLSRLRPVVPFASHHVSLVVRCKTSEASSSLKDKALKAMLNSANPGNMNGEADTTNDTNNESGGIKPAPLVFEAPKPKTSVTGSVSAASEKAKQPESSVVNAPNPLSSKQVSPNFSSGMPALHEFAPKIVVIGVGGAGNNAYVLCGGVVFACLRKKCFFYFVAVILLGFVMLLTTLVLHQMYSLNNMIAKELQGVDFLALNTDAQHLSTSLTDQRLQMGVELTRGLGAGANPDAGRM